MQSVSNRIYDDTNNLTAFTISDMERERCLAAVMAPVEEIAPVDIEARNADDVANDDFHQARGHRATRVVGRSSVSGRQTTTSQPLGKSNEKGGNERRSKRECW